MKLNIKFLLLMLFSTFIISCEDDGYEDYNAGETAVKEMSGEWYVQFLVDGEDVYGIGYTLLDTYNTAANNSTEMWVNDNLNTWVYKVKVPVNLETKTFSGENLESSVDDDDEPSTPNYEVTASITDGKILDDAAVTEAGNVTDSIHFYIEFSDYPGTTFEVAGYKRTGFLEDEH